jgi:hypothetical protein
VEHIHHNDILKRDYRLIYLTMAIGYRGFFKK